MSRIRGKDTKPELMLKKAVYARGGRFRIHAKDLPGRPDLANKRARLVVFVDGCFWHGCPAHFRVPKTRRKFWNEKIARNRRTRSKVLREYAPDWRVIEVFECALRNDLDAVAKDIAKDLQSGGS